MANTYTDAGFSTPSLYHLPASTPQLLLNYGPIFYLLCALPVMWSLDRHGLAPTVLSGIALVLASNLLRLLANDASPASTALIHASFILNAAAGPAAMAVPSKLAEVWFPPQERTLATAIAALGNQSGTLLLYLLIAVAFPLPTRAQNLGLNACLAALSVVNALMALAYFPSAPPLPPSASARIAHAGQGSVTLRALGAASARLLRSPAYLVILAAYALSTGIMNCVGAMLPQNLAALPNAADPAFNPQGIAGYINLASNAGSTVVGVALAWAADRHKGAFAGAQKAVLVACTAGSGVAFLAYAFLMRGSGSLGGGSSSASLLWEVAGTYTGAVLFQGASIPLMFDIAAEQTGVRSSSSAGAGEGGGGGCNPGDSLLGKGQGGSEGADSSSSNSSNSTDYSDSDGSGTEGDSNAPVPTGTMLMVLTAASNAVSLVTLCMPSASFFLWANWAGAGVYLGSALALGALLPGTLPRFKFDQTQAGLGGVQ